MDKSLLLSAHHHLGIQINHFLDGVGTDTRINHAELNRVLNERLNSFSNPNIERFFRLYWHCLKWMMFRF